MAIWRVARTREGLKVTYEQVRADSVFTCGVVRDDTPDALLLEWLVAQDAANPWDLVVLPGDRVLHILPQCGSGQ